MNQFKTFTIYAGTIFLNAAASFATFSLLTHHLNKVDFGIINLYNATLIFLTPFIGVGVQFTLSVDYFRLSLEAYQKHFTNALLIPILSTLFFIAVCFSFQKFIIKNTGINLAFVVLLPAIAFMMVLNDITIGLIRNKGKHVLFAVFSVAKNLVEIGLTILFVIVLNANWQGRLGSNLLAMLVATIATLFLVSRWKLLKGEKDGTEVKKIFSTGLPFIPERLAIFVMGYSDRFFINHYNGTEDVGFYSAGAQIAIILNLVILTLNNTFYPSLFKKLSQPDIDYTTVRRNIFLFLVISAVMALSVLATIPLIFHYFIGPAFANGKIYAVNLVIGLFFWAVYNGFLPFLLNLKKNRVIMFISISGMTLSLISNFFSVRYFGALGATYTSILVYFFMAVVTIFFTHKFYNLRRIFIPS